MRKVRTSTKTTPGDLRMCHIYGLRGLTLAEFCKTLNSVQKSAATKLAMPDGDGESNPNDLSFARGTVMEPSGTHQAALRTRTRGGAVSRDHSSLAYRYRYARFRCCS